MKRKNKSITHLLSICRILCLIILTTIVSQRGTFAQVDPTISDSQEKKKEAVPETKSAVRGVYTLGEIVVASPRETREGAGSISIIGADDIKRQNAQSLGEALQLVPGAYFRQSRYQQGNYVSLRGFDQENVLVLLDGVPLNVPYDGLLNLRDIPVQNISSIKVLKGMPSLLYGPNGMGGVINIISKKGEKEPTLDVSYQQSQHQTIHASAGHGWRIGDFSYYISAGHQRSDGYSLAREFAFPSEITANMPAGTAPPSDSGIRQNSDYERNSAAFTGNYDFSDNHRLGVSLEYYHNDYGIPTVAIFNENKKGQFSYVPRYWRFTDWERITANLTEESKITNSLRVRFRVFYDRYDNTLKAYDNESQESQTSVSPPAFTSTFNDYSFGYNVYAFWTGIRNNTLRFGISGKQDVHRVDYSDPSGESPRDEMTSRTYSYAIEDELELFDRLTLTAGASYDRFDKYEIDLPTKPTVELGNDMDAVSYQAGAKFAITEKSEIFASFSKRVRFPTMRNLYSDGVTGPLGDPNLKEQVVYNSEAGASWEMLEWLKIEMALFYDRVHDMISFDNQTGRFEQFGRVTLAGGEAGIESRVGRVFLGRLNYNYLFARNYSTVSIANKVASTFTYDPQDLPYRPSHKVDADITVSLPWGTGISVNGSYISEQAYYDRADIANKAMTAVQGELDDCFMVNLKVSQKIWKTEAYVAVTNLLNQEYYTLYLVPGMGRTIWGGMRMEL